MQALLWNSSTGDLTYKTDYPKPTPGPNQVIVRVAYCGISGTDLNHVTDTDPENPQELILGHEICGTVESFGSESMKEILPSNARVFINPYPNCKVCEFCVRGEINFCKSIRYNDKKMGNAIGICKNGGLAQYVCVDADTVFPLPDELPTLEASLCEPLSCIAHGLKRLGSQAIKAGTNVLIFGAGVKGLLWAVTLHHKGLRRITICDTDEERRLAVDSMNFNFKLIDPSSLDSLKTPTYDTIIDCCGSETALSIATAIAKPKGTICIFGSSHPKINSSVYTMDIVMKELRIIGCFINPFTASEGVLLTKELFDAGHLNFDELNIKVYQLASYKKGIELMRQKKITKLVFKLF